MPRATPPSLAVAFVAPLPPPSPRVVARPRAHTRLTPRRPRAAPARCDRAVPRHGGRRTPVRATAASPRDTGPDHGTDDDAGYAAPGGANGAPVPSAHKGTPTDADASTASSQAPQPPPPREQQPLVPAAAAAPADKPDAAPDPALDDRPLTPQLLALALPALGALALDPLLSLIDTAFVGRLGVSSIAGVGVATLVLNVSFSIFNFLCISITPLVARALHAHEQATRLGGATGKDMGDDDSPPASRPISAALLLALSLGSVTAVALHAAAPALAALLSASPAARSQAVAYLRARAPAIPLALMAYVANGALRAFRDLRTPFFVALAANAANVGLDVVLIFRAGLGVAGAALATSASQALAVVLLLTHLLRARRLAATDLLRVPRWAEIRPLLSAGVLLAVRTLSLLGTVAYATASAARLGVVPLAAYELCRQLWVLHATLLDSLAAAAQALVASAVAAGRVGRARAVATRAIGLSVGAAALLGAAAVAAGPALPGLFTPSASVRAAAADCIRVAALAAPLNGAVFALDAVFAACADYRYLAAAIFAAAAVACAAVTAVRVAAGGVVWLWAALNVLMVARACVLAWRFFSPRGPVYVGAADAGDG